MANSIESNFPSYPYYSYIKSPPAMGMNGSGSDIQITSLTTQVNNIQKQVNAMATSQSSQYTSNTS